MNDDKETVQPPDHPAPPETGATAGLGDDPPPLIDAPDAPASTPAAGQDPAAPRALVLTQSTSSEPAEFLDGQRAPSQDPATPSIPASPQDTVTPLIPESPSTPTTLSISASHQISEEPQIQESLSPPAGGRGLGLMPPPASAPAEFLEGQVLFPDALDASAAIPALPQDPGGGLVAPPASAPAEFLEAQWAGVAEGRSPVELMRNLLAPVALPEGPPVGGGVPQPVSVRGVALGRDERVIRTLQPDYGMTVAPPGSGQALVLTNRRLIAFRGVRGYRDNHIALLTGVRQVSVHTGQRNWGAVAQGVALMAAGALLYGVVGYWLAGQFSGPNIPVLNMDLGPLIALLIILAGLLALLQNYFARPAGAIIFRGPGVELAFPFRSSLDVDQIYGFVYLAEAAARRADAGQQSQPP